MALTGAEIEQRLRKFVGRWRDEQGSERGEAQTFLNELLDCYGTDRKAVGVRFEDYGGGGFKDMIWPGVCIVEMKRASEADKLAQHRKQAFGYWMEESRKTGSAGRYVVLCAFKRFEVFEPGSFWDRPVVVFDLEELPDRREALDFLREREPRFVEDRAELTREAVAHVTDLYNRLGDRGEGGAEVRRAFLLQSVWCMFAEDLSLIPDRRFSRAIERLADDQTRSAFDELGSFFRWLDTPGQRPTSGVAQGVPYVDGGLFREPAQVELVPEERELLWEACGFNWAHVEPAIFGSLLEGALGRDRVWAFGAHYTSEADIRRVVTPTIVEPWRARIDACGSVQDVTTAREELAAYTVLDPACGSGNFLYVAYRELRLIEVSLNAVERRLREEQGMPSSQAAPVVPLANMHGIELEPFAVELARVTLLMGHARSVHELDLPDAVLPLPSLTQIRRADALKADWPRVDAIIGNPPYIGTKGMRSRLGDAYVDWLREEFGIGIKDYAVYWIRKAHDHLGKGGRAGFVTTNSIREGQNRAAGLEYVLDQGGVILNAVSSRPWSGAANVHVSIVNWERLPDPLPERRNLDGADVPAITAALRAEASLGSGLPDNEGRQFFGVVPGGAGFILSRETARELIAREDADYRHIIRPFLIGADITNNPDQRPSRFVIDFHGSLEEAMAYPAALEIVRNLVKPHRDAVRRKAYREKWWRLEEPIVRMREVLGDLTRYIACPAQAKRFFMIWCEAEWLPSNLTSVFGFEDDYAMGVLLSSIHTRWATSQSTTLETRPRYTTASFQTFPWPRPRADIRTEVHDLAIAVIGRRGAICVERQIGLTKLYNEVDEGAYADLKRLHEQLDEAVAAAYGWPSSAAHDPAESNSRLLELNRAIAAGELEYAPFD